jgi:hypothetical protein
VVSSSRDQSDQCFSPVWPMQINGGRGSSSAAFSSPCRWLLVPRTSSTPVAVWSWPTWVVESEKCFGSRVRLVGVPISFEKNFYQLPLTPLSGLPNRSFRTIGYLWIFKSPMKLLFERTKNQVNRRFRQADMAKLPKVVRSKIFWTACKSKQNGHSSLIWALIKMNE